MEKLLEGVDCKTIKTLDETRIDVSQLDKTVVVITALWSVYSKEQVQKLREALRNDATVGKELNVVFLDTDKVDYEFMDDLFKTNRALHGYGEMLWVKEGNIVFRDCRKPLTVAELQERIREICN